MIKESSGETLDTLLPKPRAILLPSSNDTNPCFWPQKISKINIPLIGFARTQTHSTNLFLSTISTISLVSSKIVRSIFNNSKLRSKEPPYGEPYVLHTPYSFVSTPRTPLSIKSATEKDGSRIFHGMCPYTPKRYRHSPSSNNPL